MKKKKSSNAPLWELSQTIKCFSFSFPFLILRFNFAQIQIKHLKYFLSCDGRPLRSASHLGFWKDERFSKYLSKLPFFRSLPWEKQPKDLEKGGPCASCGSLTNSWDIRAVHKI